jgi:GH15 family glucan-1,4-alpha-glucosidase
VTLPIEDYGIIGDLHTAALVGRDGSIDWLCLPRFDSAACFSKLLGNEDHGSWRIAPKGAHLATHRRYRGDSLVLESEFVTPEGTVRLTECMPIRERHPEVVRLVEGVRGKVEMEMKLTIRFGYGQIVPWVRRLDGTLSAIAGPDGLSLWTPVHTDGEDMSTVARFTVSEGQTVPFSLTWFPASDEPPRPVDAVYAIEDTENWWRQWIEQCTYEGDHKEAVVRSLITLKALTYEPTGGIVAAATTSLPETLGGSRNWDYRFCWLRDATLTLESLMRGGFYDEAMAWRDWLLRAIAGDPSQMQIMYGAAGERRLDEWEVEWLPGYEGSSPVRIGNAAAGQFQLDVYGEVMSALYEASRSGDSVELPAWELQRALMSYLSEGWREPDDGIWEVRGPRRHFTHSKVMAWVAIDRAIKTIEECGVEGPIDEWKKVRAEIHEQVCDQGFNIDKGSFTQYYGSDQLDASLLMIPLVGFLPAHDPRVKGTIEAVERELMDGGFVLRYRTADDGDVDGLTGREGAFLACSFWLVDCLYLLGRVDDARSMFDRLLSLRNDLGLLSEEYDAYAGRLVGNFPQAFSHVSLVNSAAKLSGHGRPSARPEVFTSSRRVKSRSTSGAGGLHRGGRTAPHRSLDGRPRSASQDEPDTAVTAGSNTAAGDTAAKDAGPDLTPRR